VTVTKAAYEAGLGEADLAKIEIVGDDLDDFIAEDFKLPQTMPLKVVPRTLLKWLLGLIKFKPYIDEHICVRCGLCKTACPISCITIDERRCGIDHRKCVRCLCCHEICPHKAIVIKRNMLTRLVWG
jgi:ferredoxin